MSELTLDEAIKHCLEVAEQQEADSFIDRWSDDDEWSESLKENCRQCAADHRQLAEWLTELKELETKHWDECRQIAHYDDEIKRLEAADVQPLSVIAEHIKNRLYETAFNTTEAKARNAIADMAGRIDFWIGELNGGEQND